LSRGSSDDPGDRSGSHPGFAEHKAALDPSDAARGLRAGEVEAEFQPRVDLVTGALTGVEALARWRRIGAVGPVRFVPALTEAGLSGELTLRMLDVSCEALRLWQVAGLAPRVTINVSMAALFEPAIALALAARARAHGCEPQRFTFELIDGDAPGTSATATLARLREERFGFATSLSQLGSFPFAELRIDRGLVRECDHSRHRQSLVRSAVDLARRLGVRTVAEGIETIGEWNVLAQAGCAEGQGYYVAPPMSAAALPRWLQTWRAAFAVKPATPDRASIPGHRA